MENSREFSDEEWVASPLLCGALSDIPFDIRWEIWEHQTLTDKEKVPIYRYWAEQFSGDPVTDEEIAVDGVIVFPDEVDLYKPYPKCGGGTGKESRFDIVDNGCGFLVPDSDLEKMYTWVPVNHLIKPGNIYMRITAFGDGFILYGEPYQDPYNPYAK